MNVEHSNHLLTHNTRHPGAHRLGRDSIEKSKQQAAPTNTTHYTSEIYNEFSFDFSGRFAIFAEEFPASTERVWVEMGA